MHSWACSPPALISFLVCCCFLEWGLSSCQGHAELLLDPLSPPAVTVPTPWSSCPSLVQNLQRPLSFTCKRPVLPGVKDPMPVQSETFQDHLAQICHFSEKQIEPQRRDFFKVMWPIRDSCGRPDSRGPDSKASAPRATLVHLSLRSMCCWERTRWRVTAPLCCRASPCDGEKSIALGMEPQANAST